MTACCKTADQPLMEDSGSFLATNDKPFCEALYRVSRFKENRLLVADLIAHFSTNLTPKAWLDDDVTFGLIYQSTSCLSALAFFRAGRKNSCNFLQCHPESLWLWLWRASDTDETELGRV